MVIGNGLIARAFNEYEADNGIVLFASGVSNSANTDDAAFNREKKLLASQLSASTGKKFIYFSTCSIYDASLQHSRYVKHKLEMEKIIIDMQTDYLVFRISNLAGKTDNPNTVLNFFIHHILSGKSFYVWEKAYRNIIDISDAFLICRYIIANNLFPNQAVNIANPFNYAVRDIVTTIEKHFGKKGNYTIIDKESNPVIDISKTNEIIKQLDINFDGNYLERTIQKYFPLNDV